jgi:hypothetical protein
VCLCAVQLHVVKYQYMYTDYVDHNKKNRGTKVLRICVKFLCRAFYYGGI